jgi:CRISPR-associated protein Cas2
MTLRRLHLVAYDIASRRRRRLALRAAKAHGLGGQKSVHECWLSRRERRELDQALRRIIAAEQDRLLILRFDPRSRIEALGVGQVPELPPFFYLG